MDNEEKKDIQEQNEEEVVSEEESDDLGYESFTYTIDNNNVNGDYNKNKYDDSKSFMYILIGIVILVFIIMLLVFFANGGKDKNMGYSGIESRMVSGAKKYYDKYPDKLPIQDGSSITISSDTLIENSYLKPFSEMVDEGVSCSGNVSVFNINGNYSYFPYLKCDGEYESIKLSKKIVDEAVVSSGDGLYSVGDHYIFRGEYPNNYVKFNNSLWRILGINSDGSIKLLYADKSKEKNVWDDRYNSSKDAYSGINDFRVSRLLEYLEKVYTEYTYVDKKNVGLLVKHDWCIGKISESDQPIANLNLCSDVYNDLYIGTVQVDDVLVPSLDSNCSNLYDVDCTNYNYLFSINTGWTLNASSDRSYIVFNSNGGVISFKNASTDSYVRPVININNNVLYSRGSGTAEDPYLIGD